MCIRFVPIGVLCAAVCVSFAKQSDAAGAAPTSLTDNYSTYEKETIALAERLLSAQLDPLPEGKRIEQVDVLSLDPVEPRDPVPTALNVLHVSTRRYVVERELLLRVGSRYRKILADESARNLRALPQLSVVLCLAFEGSSKDRVRLVVITKDVWSLILDFDVGAFNLSSGYLLLEPKETNLLGTHQNILGRFRLDPKTYSFGSAYRIPRPLGRKFSVIADANVILNRDSETGEGSYGTLEVVQPLRTSWDKWAWFSAVSWRHDVARQFEPTGRVLQESGIPFEWRRQESQGQLALTRSFGWAIKHDFTVSPSVGKSAYRLPKLEGVDPNAILKFEQGQVPKGDTRGGLGFEWHSYTSSFLRTFDLETLGLQEDYRLGHEIVLGVQPAAGTLLGNNRTFLAVGAAVQETVPISNGYWRASALWQSDTQIASTSDASVTLASYFATPRLGFGRLIQAAWFTDHYHNLRTVKEYIGGSSRLRGYGLYNGSSAFAMNLEYRTPGLKLFELQFGAVAFYDSADAFDSFSEFKPRHSAGAGLRMVVPQVERAVFRLDFGVPISPYVKAGETPPDRYGIYFTFGQAFDSRPIHGIAPPIALTTE